MRTKVEWVNRTNRNVIAILPGSDAEKAQEAIILSAYYDSISVVPKWSPGAENALGIATMLELARLYKAHPPARSIVFIATSGHPEAMTGAREFAATVGTGAEA